VFDLPLSCICGSARPSRSDKYRALQGIARSTSLLPAFHFIATLPHYPTYSFSPGTFEYPITTITLSNLDRATHLSTNEIIVYTPFVGLTLETNIRGCECSFSVIPWKIHLPPKISKGCCLDAFIRIRQSRLFYLDFSLVVL